MHEQLQDVDESSTPPIYHSKPQTWLRPLHATADLGYAGFFPPHPGQEEDLLSLRAVKYGFSTESRVSAEAFSAKAVIENFHSDEVFLKLEEMVNELFARRVDSLPSVPTSTFRLPTRVTLNETKRQAWFRDLADPKVPLYKLGKSVPHGAKGHDLLDLLHTNSVAIPRATWFLRVFGANEVAGLRNKPSYNPTQYSIDWAIVVTSYIKKQLSEIALPSPPRAGLNIKQTFKGVLTDTESRERWVSRFSYCLQLLRVFYAEGMVDKRTFLAWLVLQMSTCNLAQAGFVACLADEYLTDITESRALSHYFVDASLNKLHEILSGDPAMTCLGNTSNLLKTLMQRVSLVMTDAFISPRTWTTYSHLICNVLVADWTSHGGNHHSEQRKAVIQKDILANFRMIEARNNRLLYLTVQPTVQSTSSVADIKLLNSISSEVDLRDIVFFTSGTGDAQTFAAKLDILFNWSITPFQYGDHRPFVAVSLLDSWRKKESERAHRRGLMSPYDFLQDQLFEWLDLSPAARAQGTFDSVALLYGYLIENDLFRYSTYLQRLVARGEPILTIADVDGSHHKHFVRSIPLSNSNPSLLNQRKALLYGLRTREVPEEANERQIRKEIRAILPPLFTVGRAIGNVLASEIVSTCPMFVTSSRFEKVRTIKYWLFPILQDFVRQLAGLDSSTYLQVYGISVQLMVLAKSFDCVADLILSVLQNATSNDVLTASVNYIYRYGDVWQCMGVLGKLVVQLDATHQVLQAQGHRSHLLFDILRLDSGRYLNQVAHDRITSDIAHFTSALRPTASHPEPVPRELPEIFRLRDEGDPDFPSRLANSLWIKYRTSSEWGMIVWENVLVGLHRISNGIIIDEDRNKYAFRYGTFLRHIDQHLPAGLDEEVSQWLGGPGFDQITRLEPEIWDLLSPTLVYLAAHRALRITTLLTRLVFPSWDQSASVAQELQPGALVVHYIQAANKLCGTLLLQRTFDNELPANVLLVQCLESQRQMVYSEPFFPTLIARIPILITIENNPHLPGSISSAVKELRCKLCREEAFRRAVYRDLDTTREAFERTFISEFEGKRDGSDFTAGLKDVLCSGDEDAGTGQWRSSTHLLSTPWKLAATSIHLQLVLKGLGQGLGHQATRDQAMSSLDKVAQDLFHSRITSEEACYIREVTRGADDVVIGKLIASGLRRVVEILTTPTSTEDASSEYLSWANEVMRAVLHLTGPGDGARIIPGLDSSIHELLLAALYDKLVVFDQIMALEHQYSTVLTPVVALLRLLQFTLGFRGTWTDKARDDGVSLSSLLFRVTLRLCAGSDAEVSVYPLFLDTLYYLLDELPHDAKVAFDPFRYYPRLIQSEISADIAPEHRKQLLALSTQLSPNSTVSDLLASSRDAQGNIVHGTPVVNKPWEWVEYLGEPVNDISNSLKNSGSLSLELFGAKMTGDGIIPALTEDGSVENVIRTFEDGLSAESMFRRDWRESRVAIADDSTAHTTGWRSGAEQESEGGMGTIISARGNAAQKAERKSSSGRQSPSHTSTSRISDSTLSETGEQESTSTTSSKAAPSSKRKLDGLSDEETGIVDGPEEAKRSTKRVKPKGRTKRR